MLVNARQRLSEDRKTRILTSSHDEVDLCEVCELRLRRKAVVYLVDCVWSYSRWEGRGYLSELDALRLFRNHRKERTR
jgi:hypothetical protein